MRCKFCEEYRRDFFAELQRQTKDWEYWNSLDDDLWDREDQSDLDIIKRANKLLESDACSAISQLQTADEHGSAFAARHLGWQYSTGEYVERDISQALHHYKKGWERGSELSGLDYAKCSLEAGDHAENDAALQRLMAEGFIAAHYLYAWQVADNEKLSGTHEKVLPYLRTAAENGHPSAMFWFGRMMFRGKLGLKNVPVGAKMFWPLVMRIHKEL